NNGAAYQDHLDCYQGPTTNVDAREWNGGAISNGTPIHRGNVFIKSFGEVNISSSTISGGSRPNPYPDAILQCRKDLPVPFPPEPQAIRGGAIENGDGGLMVIVNSTISGNHAARGGGIYNTKS